MGGWISRRVQPQDVSIIIIVHVVANVLDDVLERYQRSREGHDGCAEANHFVGGNFPVDS